MAPGSAGNKAPFGGLFFALKVSQIVSMVTHSTPSNLLMFSMWLRRTSVSELASFLSLLHSPLQHHQPVRVAADIWVYGHGVDEASLASLASFVGFDVFAVEELEAVHPHFFDVAWVYPAVAVGGFFL
jgi:hypothetical protein